MFIEEKMNFAGILFWGEQPCAIRLSALFLWRRLNQLALQHH